MSLNDGRCVLCFYTGQSDVEKRKCSQLANESLAGTLTGSVTVTVVG